MPGIDYASPGPLTSLAGVSPPALEPVRADPVSIASLYHHEDLQVPPALIA